MENNKFNNPDESVRVADLLICMRDIRFQYITTYTHTHSITSTAAIHLFFYFALFFSIIFFYFIVFASFFAFVCSGFFFFCCSFVNCSLVVHIKLHLEHVQCYCSNSNWTGSAAWNAKVICSTFAGAACIAAAATSGSRGGGGVRYK